MNIKRRKLIYALSRPLQRFWSGRVTNPVFIIGCSRSGTTLLSRLLSYHHDVAEWSEANDVWDPVSVRRDNDGYPLHFWDETQWYIEDWRISMADRHQEIRAIFGFYQTLLRRSCFVNKSPINTFRVPDIVHIFPDARIIHMVRDGRAVSVSYAHKLQQKFGEHPDQYAGTNLMKPFDEMVVAMGAFWKLNLEEVARQDNALALSARQKMIELTYESLCDDRDRALKTICDFIGLDAGRFSPRLAQEPIASRNDKWRQEVGAELLRKMDAAMQPLLSNRGYR